MKRAQLFVIEAAGLLLLLILMLPLPAASVERSRLKTDLTLGYDSFIDRFTILEEDTSDTMQEIFLSLGTDFFLPYKGTRLNATNTFKYGDQAITEYFNGRFSAGSRERLLFDLRHSLRMKFFREGSDYEFGNDYIQTNTSAKLTKKLASSAKVSLKGRMEHIDYDERTDFDYDYQYFDGGLEIEVGSYFGNFLKIGGIIGSRSVPDTTALSYDRRIADLEVHLQPSDGTLLEVSMSGDRRKYRGDTRSPLWNVYSYTSLSIIGPNGARYALRLDSESYIYDEPSTTFFDSHFLRGGFRCSLPAGKYVTASAEPRYARLFCEDFQEERYSEVSVVLGLDILGGSDYWLSLSWEPGKRNYIQDDNEIYSDFTLNRISVMGSIKTAEGMTLGLFLMHDPEKHARRDDDFSITMISATITKEF